MTSFRILSVVVLLQAARGQPCGTCGLGCDHCDHVDFGSCGNACCKLTIEVPYSAEATAAMLNATVQTGGPDGAYTVQLMAEGVSGVADLRPFNVSADFIGQARHFTQGETRYEDVIDFNIKATATGARVTFFSLSLIGGALGDAGQNYLNIYQIADATFTSEDMAALVHADTSCPDPSF